jgi:hypothetical protein
MSLQRVINKKVLRHKTSSIAATLRVDSGNTEESTTLDY